MSEKQEKDRDTQVSEGELIVTPSPHTIGLFNDKMTRHVTNFTGDRQQMWRFTALCKSGSAKPLQDETGKVLEIRYYFCHPVQVKGQAAGEIMDCIRTVLVTPSNELYESVSDGVASFVRDAITFFPEGAFNPPLQVKVIQKMTRSKFRTILLEPVL